MLIGSDTLILTYFANVPNQLSLIREAHLVWPLFFYRPIYLQSFAFEGWLLIGTDNMYCYFFQEVCAALQSKCNIIPIIDNFQWPEAEELPEDMRSIVTFNGVR